MVSTAPKRTVLVLLSLAVMGMSQSLAAVFGADDRSPLPAAKSALADKIGTLVSSKTGALCTAFCVAPGTIATASHCLFGTSVSGKPDLSRLVFRLASAPNGPSTPIAGRRTASQTQHIIAGTTRLSVTPPIGANRDWAVVRLETAACHAGGLALSTGSAAEIQAAGERGEIYQVAVHRDVPDTALKHGRPCSIHTAFPDAGPDVLARDFANPGAILFHTCDTGGGSSGSPLLIDGPGGPEVVGINVGTYVFSRSIIAAGTGGTQPSSEAIANTAVATREFAAAVHQLSMRPAPFKATSAP